ncbi:PREDICTED: uncharacterized protein K02A2.6-like [Nelumbo nucifera]|uniref:Uncharacterized protein K02A2.6-like n=1 Tax=Nelumbo nucifera TaxID=4432 RepID=A0A1U8AUX8_NELNU|nr:PREDICTED: uncharacterized protein K02A2.6-like [Nelumbo nucifera]
MVIEESWNKASKGQSLHVLGAKSMRLRAELKKWNNESFGLLSRKIEEAKSDFERALHDPGFICRFGIPHVLSIDNGTQFIDKKFEALCANLRIDHRTTAVHQPQSNGQTEVTNRILLHGLKTHLDQAKGRWVEELLSILCAYRTTPRTATRETPFKLTYGSEAMIPVEISSPTLRTELFDKEQNDEDLRAELDLVEEARDRAYVKMVAQQQKMTRHYDSKVRRRKLKTFDFVLRKIIVPTTGEGNFRPNWEGLYRVTRVLGPGTYRLEDLEGRQILMSWNSGNLKMYYQ